MAGTVVAGQQISSAGVIPAYVAGAAQMEIPNSGTTVLHAKASGIVNITLKNQTVQEGNPGPDKVINIGAGAEKVITIPKGLFNLPNGNAQIAIDTPANVTLTAYVLP